ncbi:MAG: RIP metalloprotease [Actinobacteria bacterium]|nr:RIP metalloprotease [Actinomycetota bacterium]
MSFTLGIVAFFVGLLLVILIHELGHFTVARAFGFKVEEYFVGFGPKLWSTRRGEIEYGVKALPLGGYVKIAGMNPYQPVAPEDLPRAYGSKPRWQRALVIFAGPGIHLVIAAVLFGAYFLVSGDYSTATPVVSQVAATLNGHVSPASEAGLRVGDRIVRVGDLDTPNLPELGDYTTAHVGEPVEFTVIRDGESVRLTITPEEATDPAGGSIGRVGIVLDAEDPGSVGPVTAATSGVKEVGSATAESFGQIGKVFGPEGIGRVTRLVFTDAERRVEDPTSVVGIGRAVGKTGAAGDWSTILYFLGFVTVFIGLVNLMPLPPFDGGHLAVLLIEKIRGRTIDQRRIIPVAVAVMGFFIVFVALTMIADLTKPAT